jgi:hypothetical protein
MNALNGVIRLRGDIIAAGFNRRMRKTARTVVWEGAGNQSGPRPDPAGTRYALHRRSDGTRNIRRIRRIRRMVWAERGCGCGAGALGMEDFLDLTCALLGKDDDGLHPIFPQ